MCGICGWLGRYDIEKVILMRDAMTARGPDDAGLYHDEHVALGHRRLSIIDPSPAGHQPMSYAGGRYWITYNGEIYNYRELCNELKNKGFSFQSQSDTEVILAAYSQWGEECLERLRGMFAFAIWDQEAKSLFLARDRLGMKPLLYYSNGKELLFASELKAFLKSKVVEPVVDYLALFDYLAMGSVIQPKTMIQSVRQIEPGNSLTVTADGSIKKRCYWNFTDALEGLRKSYLRCSFSELVEITREKLEETCRLHMIADVPIGSFLSGGIDSTTLTALMARYASYPIRSFSVGFSHTAEVDDELSYAKRAAEYIGCRHEEIILTGDEVARNFDMLIESIDQPSQDGTNTYFVSRAASRQLKVTLSGLGGDELFAGYPHFNLLFKAHRREANMLDWVFSKVHDIYPNRFTRLSHNRYLSLGKQLAELRRILPDSKLGKCLSPGLVRFFNSGFIEAQIQRWLHDGLDLISQISLVECNGYLRNTLLRDNDIMSMAHSLEVRPVLLDHLLVEHAIALPPEAKIRKGVMKAALIESVRDLLPEDIIIRKKQGFELPLGSWLQTDLKKRFLDCVRDPRARDIFSYQFLRQCENSIGNFRKTRILWMVFILLEWLRKTHFIFPG